MVFNFAAGVQKRLFKFIFKRALGRFLAHEIDLSQVDVQLLSGAIQLKNLTLNTEALNEFLSHLPVSVSLKSGYVHAVRATVPWKNILNDSMEFEINGLEVCFSVGVPAQPTPRRSARTAASNMSSMSESMVLGHQSSPPQDLLASSVILGDIRTSDIVNEVTYGPDSPPLGPSSLMNAPPAPAFAPEMVMSGEFGSADSFPASSFSSSSTSSFPPSSSNGPKVRPQDFEGMRIIAQAIERTLSNIKANIMDATVRFECERCASKSKVVLLFHLPKLEFSDTTPQDPAQQQQQQNASEGSGFSIPISGSSLYLVKTVKLHKFLVQVFEENSNGSEESPSASSPPITSVLDLGSTILSADAKKENLITLKYRTNDDPLYGNSSTSIDVEVLMRSLHAALTPTQLSLLQEVLSHLTNSVKPSSSSSSSSSSPMPSSAATSSPRHRAPAASSSSPQSDIPLGPPSRAPHSHHHSQPVPPTPPSMSNSDGSLLLRADLFAHHVSPSTSPPKVDVLSQALDSMNQYHHHHQIDPAEVDDFFKEEEDEDGYVSVDQGGKSDQHQHHDYYHQEQFYNQQQDLKHHVEFHAHVYVHAITSTLLYNATHSQLETMWSNFLASESPPSNLFPPSIGEYGGNSKRPILAEDHLTLELGELKFDCIGPDKVSMELSIGSLSATEFLVRNAVPDSKAGASAPMPSSASSSSGVSASGRPLPAAASSSSSSSSSTSSRRDRGHHLMEAKQVLRFAPPASSSSRTGHKTSNVFVGVNVELDNIYAPPINRTSIDVRFQPLQIDLDLQMIERLSKALQSLPASAVSSSVPTPSSSSSSSSPIVSPSVNASKPTRHVSFSGVPEQSSPVRGDMDAAAGAIFQDIERQMTLREKPLSITNLNVLMPSVKLVVLHPSRFKSVVSPAESKFMHRPEALSFDFRTLRLKSEMREDKTDAVWLMEMDRFRIHLSDGNGPAKCIVESDLEKGDGASSSRLVMEITMRDSPTTANSGQQRRFQAGAAGSRSSSSRDSELNADNLEAVLTPHSSKEDGNFLHIPSATAGYQDNYFEQAAPASVRGTFLNRAPAPSSSSASASRVGPSAGPSQPDSFSSTPFEEDDEEEESPGTRDTFLMEDELGETGRQDAVLKLAKTAVRISLPKSTAKLSKSEFYLLQELIDELTIYITAPLGETVVKNVEDFVSPLDMLASTQIPSSSIVNSKSSITAVTINLAKVRLLLAVPGPKFPESHTLSPMETSILDERGRPIHTFEIDLQDVRLFQIIHNQADTWVQLRINAHHLAIHERLPTGVLQPILRKTDKVVKPYRSRLDAMRMAITYKQNSSLKMVDTVVQMSFHGLLMNHYQSRSGDNWIFTIIDFLDEDPALPPHDPLALVPPPRPPPKVADWKKFSQIFLQMTDCGIDYSPLAMDSRALLHLGTFRFSTQFLTGAELVRFVLRFEDTSLLMHCDEKEDLLASPDSNEPSDMGFIVLMQKEGYSQVASLNSLDINIINNKGPVTHAKPGLSVECSKSDIVFSTCADSFETFVDTFMYWMDGSDNLFRENEKLRQMMAEGLIQPRIPESAPAPPQPRATSASSSSASASPILSAAPSSSSSSCLPSPGMPYDVSVPSFDFSDSILSTPSSPSPPSASASASAASFNQRSVEISDTISLAVNTLIHSIQQQNHTLASPPPQQQAPLSSSIPPHSSHSSSNASGGRGSMILEDYVPQNPSSSSVSPSAPSPLSSAASPLPIEIDSKQMDILFNAHPELIRTAENGYAIFEVSKGGSTFDPNAFLGLMNQDGELSLTPEALMLASASSPVGQEFLSYEGHNDDNGENDEGESNSYSSSDSQLFSAASSTVLSEDQQFHSVMEQSGIHNVFASAFDDHLQRSIQQEGQERRFSEESPELTPKGLINISDDFFGPRGSSSSGPSAPSPAGNMSSSANVINISDNFFGSEKISPASSEKDVSFGFASSMAQSQPHLYTRYPALSVPPLQPAAAPSAPIASSSFSSSSNPIAMPSSASAARNHIPAHVSSNTPSLGTSPQAAGRWFTAAPVLRALDEHHFPLPRDADMSSNGLDLSIPSSHPLPELEIQFKDVNLVWHLYGGSDWPEATPDRVGIGSSKRYARRTRDGDRLLDLSAENFLLKFDIFPDDEQYAWRMILSIRDFEIIDRLRVSNRHKFFCYMREAENPREAYSRMISIFWDSVRPSMETPADQEWRLRVHALPFRVNADQDTLEFLSNFFASVADISTIVKARIQRRIADGPSEVAHQFSIPAAPSKDPYIQQFAVNDLKIRLDYRPKHVDVEKMRAGSVLHYAIIPIENLALVLNGANLSGVTGFPRLFVRLAEGWSTDIRQGQIHRCVSGIQPIRSLVNISSGLSDLIVVPLEQYRRDGRILRGVRGGVGSFIRKTTVEAVTLGSHLASGAQNLLEHAGGLVSNSTSPRNPSSAYSPASFSSSAPSPLVSVAASHSFANYRQPRNASEGLMQGLSSLTRGFKNATHAIVDAPMERYREQGVHAFAKSMVTGVPTALISPLIGATEALSRALVGIRNSVNPPARDENEETFKKP